MSSAADAVNALLADSGIDSFFVGVEEVGLRADKLLAARYPTQHSRAYFQYLIGRGSVLVGGIPLVKKGFPLAVGSEVEVHFDALPPLEVIPEALPLAIVYEDDEIIVVDKAPGMVVHPAPGHSSGTLVNALFHHCREAPLWRDGVAPDDRRPGIVHRLDKDTSGLLIAVKTVEAHRRFVTAFAERQVQKRYLALCIGNPGDRTIEGSIGRHQTNRHKMAIHVNGGREALTRCKTLYSHRGMSVAVAAPHTGRTHQIRVHFQSVGCPIIGDALYGSPSYNQRLGVDRQLLHAWQLAFNHPMSGKPLIFTVPPPGDFLDFLKKQFISYQQLFDNQTELFSIFNI